MCWNEHVSLNTFMFSMGALSLLIYNNAYTPYKVPMLDGYWYFFLFSFCSMQLVDFFLWRNLNNPQKNFIYSLIGQLILVIQPFASLLMLRDIKLKTLMLSAYAIFLAFATTKYDISKINTKVHNGHLQWNWANGSHIDFVVMMFFLYFSFFVNKNYWFIAITTFLFAITYFSNHYLDRTGGSLWCWSINILMLLYLIYLLIVAPFKEYGMLC
jgi:hypothetical protein